MLRLAALDHHYDIMPAPGRIWNVFGFRFFGFFVLFFFKVEFVMLLRA